VFRLCCTIDLFNSALFPTGGEDQHIDGAEQIDCFAKDFLHAGFLRDRPSIITRYNVGIVLFKKTTCLEKLVFCSRHKEDSPGSSLRKALSNGPPDPPPGTWELKLLHISDVPVTITFFPFSAPLRIVFGSTAE
jgi:hypothetical protein